MGSWRFIIIQTLIVCVWIILDTIALTRHWDPYPFILLNLVFSTQAAYASPLILMAGNLQADRDRARDDHEAEEVTLLTTEVNLLTEQLAVLKTELTVVYEINQRQLEILELLHQGSV